VELLVDCRKYQHNLLLNVGPMADGKLTEIESGTLKYMGKWVAKNEAVVYNCVPADIQAENADIVTDGKYYYALIKKVPMSANAHVARVEDNLRVTLKTDKRIVSAVWLDNNAPVSAFDECGFYAEPFMYGTSLGVRVAKLELE
jgi:alpha-L-fucosidase